MLVHMPCDATEEGSQALVKLSFIHSVSHSTIIVHIRAPSIVQLRGYTG